MTSKYQDILDDFIKFNNTGNYRVYKLDSERTCNNCYAGLHRIIGKNKLKISIFRRRKNFIILLK